MIQSLLGECGDKDLSYDIVSPTRIINNVEDKDVISVESGSVILIKNCPTSGEKGSFSSKKGGKSRTTASEDGSKSVREKGFHDKLLF